MARPQQAESFLQLRQVMSVLPAQVPMQWEVRPEQFRRADWHSHRVPLCSSTPQLTRLGKAGILQPENIVEFS